MTSDLLVPVSTAIDRLEPQWRYTSFMAAPEILSVAMVSAKEWRLYTELAPTRLSPYFKLKTRPTVWKAWVYPEMPDRTRERLKLLWNVLNHADTREAKHKGNTVWGYVAQPARWMLESREFQDLGLTGTEKGEPEFEGHTRFEALRRILHLPEGAGGERWFFDVGGNGKTLSLSKGRLSKTLATSPAETVI